MTLNEQPHSTMSVTTSWQTITRFLVASDKQKSPTHLRIRLATVIGAASIFLTGKELAKGSRKGGRVFLKVN
jgi:hypothetical protein